MLKKKRLLNISKSINSGITPYRENPLYWQNGNIPWLKTEQLGTPEIYDTTEKITKLALEETSIKLNPKNTLSVAMYGEGKTRGNVSVLKNEMTTNQACCNIVIDKEKAYYKYVYYFLKTQYNQLRNLSSGVRKNLNSNDIKQFEIVLPEDISTQKQIASVLSNLDSKIELNNRINRELEQMAKLLYDYWFVQFDFPDANGKPYKSSEGKMVWNKELKREIPVGWEVRELGTEMEFQRGISYTSKEINGGGIPMINLNSFNLDGTYKPDGVKNYSGKFTEKNIAKSGELLIAATDVTRNADIIGKAIIVPNYYDNDLVFSMDIAKIIPFNIPCSFLMLLFNSNHYHNYIRWYATGTLVLHLNLDGVKRYKTEIPPMYLLEKFDSLYQPIANRIYKTTKENHHLTTLRDWLLPMLMNGQVRVGEAGKKEYQPNETEMDLAAEPGD